MLFTDANIVTSADLAVIDSEFLKIATTENMVVDASPQSSITRSCSEIGNDLMAKFQNFSGYLVGIGYTANHLAAVLNVLSTAINRPRARLNQIVVIDPDPTQGFFKRFAEFACLRDFYRSIFHRKIDDRFEKRMNLFAAEAKRMFSIVKSNGFPIVISPLAAPGATREFQSGTWGTANVTAQNGASGDQGNTYVVAITWVNSANYISQLIRGNGESAPSALVNVTVAANQVIHIDITSLNPPSGSLPPTGTAAGVYTPQPATGWNVWVGLQTKDSSAPTLYLQNGTTTPIPVATKTYTLASIPLLSAFIMGAGQFPDYLFSVQNMIWRA